MKRSTLHATAAVVTLAAAACASPLTLDPSENGGGGRLRGMEPAPGFCRRDPSVGAHGLR
jgi:hypothetical protein